MVNDDRNIQGPASFFWDDVRDPIMSSPSDVLLIFDCQYHPVVTSLGDSEQLFEPDIPVIEPGLVSSPSTKQLLGVFSLAVTGNSFEQGRGVEKIEKNASELMTQSLCRALDRFHNTQVSVQSLCSYMKEDLRTQERTASGVDRTVLASRVFMTQLGGGRLLDIYLPVFLQGR